MRYSDITGGMDSLLRSLNRHNVAIYIPRWRESWQWEFQGNDDILVRYTFSLRDSAESVAELEISVIRTRRFRYLIYIHLYGNRYSREHVHFYVSEIHDQLYRYRFKRSVLSLLEATLPEVAIRMDGVYDYRMATHRELVQQSSDSLPYVESAALVGLQFLPEPKSPVMREGPGRTLYYALSYAVLTALRNLERIKTPLKYTQALVPLEVQSVKGSRDHPDALGFRLFTEGYLAPPYTMHVIRDDDERWQIELVTAAVPAIISYLCFDIRPVSELVRDLIEVTEYAQ